MICKENEIWNIVKELCVEYNLNRFDTYLFVFNHIKKLEGLLHRRLSLSDIRNEIKKSIDYIISEK